jgi:hypothetical protein
MEDDNNCLGLMEDDNNAAMMSMWLSSPQLCATTIKCSLSGQLVSWVQTLGPLPLHEAGHSLTIEEVEKDGWRIVSQLHILSSWSVFFFELLNMFCVRSCHQNHLTDKLRHSYRPTTTHTHPHTLQLPGRGTSSAVTRCR